VKGANNIATFAGTTTPVTNSLVTRRIQPPGASHWGNLSSPAIECRRKTVQPRHYATLSRLPSDPGHLPRCLRNPTRMGRLAATYGLSDFLPRLQTPLPRNYNCRSFPCFSPGHARPTMKPSPGNASNS